MVFAVLVLGGSGSAQLVPPDATADQATQSFVGGPNQHFGFDIDSAGDWNGDGLDDVAASGLTIGAHANTSEVRVMYDLDSASPLEFTVTNIASQLWAPSVALAEDLDGRGIADLVIGAPDWTDDPNDPTRAEMGRVYVFFGENWNGSASTQDVEGADIILEGDTPFRRFGFSVADAGDVNGDGLSDLLIGSPGCHSLDIMTPCPNSPDTFEGEATLVYGGVYGFEQVTAVAGMATPIGPTLGPSGLPLGAGTTSGITFRGPLSASIVLTGSASSDRFGFSVATLGDLNGDGRSEYAVGAIRGVRSRAVGYRALDGTPGMISNTGYVNVYSMTMTAPIGTIRPNVNPATEWATLFGLSISAMGDVDFDGINDIVIGAPGTSPIRMGAPDGQQGAVFVYSGSEAYANAATSHIFSSLNLFTPGPNGNELDSDAQFGFSVAGAASTINNDSPAPNVTDLIAGGWKHQNTSGLALVLTPGPLDELSILKRIGGPLAANHDRFGSAVAIGHVYQANEPDVIGGAFGQAITGSTAEEGFVHVFDYQAIFP